LEKSSRVLLEVKDLSKRFFEYKSEWHRIAKLFGVDVKPKMVHNVLKNLSFVLRAGEAVGIVGANGAGKSTLLKIITGTLRASSGTVKVDGRISAILELGMGFHPDLSGRQNVYHSAGIMGFSKEQIDGMIDEIEAFAEIGDYFDQPVRLYSSGMQMRVAFSVATAWRPELLIVDEALSVGDAYFQHKSFDRIREFQESGTTLLLVSHDASAIQAICDRAILLDGGVIIQDGEPEAVMDYYNALIAQKENFKIKQKRLDDGKVTTISGSREATLSKIELLDIHGEKVEFVGTGDKVRLRVVVDVRKDIPNLVVGYKIRDRLGQEIFGTNSYYHNRVVESGQKGEQYIYQFDFEANLGVGSYSISIAAHANESHVVANYEWRDKAIIFNVVNISKPNYVGVSWLPTEIDVIKG
jgi:lipopolysaccharide transport system ATP-binding protein